MFFLNSNLARVGVVLLQQVTDICQNKIDTHLDMLPKNPMKASAELD
jgi:hypothetical protein